jgi:hypothetical protein
MAEVLGLDGLDLLHFGLLVFLHIFLFIIFSLLQAIPGLGWCI